MFLKCQHIVFVSKCSCSPTTCCRSSFWASIYEPPHDKTNKMTVPPAKTQISLGIRPVWSESSLCVQWVAISQGPKLSSCGQRRLWSDWADAQADLRLCGAHMPFCWFCHGAAHITMMGILRQQFYPRMRQAGQDRKISDSHKKWFSCPMCDNGLSQMM